MSRFSKTQIDKLGDRLREGDLTDEDLRMLDEYRLEFRPVYDLVLKQLRKNPGAVIIGRAAKSTPSIIHKLRRFQTCHVRLSQIQDIAGLRVVVDGIENQNETVHRLKGVFPDAVVDDRRKRPSHGYRAVHVIATLNGMQVEIQVRTALQHIWAQVCERLADKLGMEVKYGGNAGAQDLLEKLSTTIREIEGEGSGVVQEPPPPYGAGREELFNAFHALVSFTGKATQARYREDRDVFPH